MRTTAIQLIGLITLGFPLIGNAQESTAVPKLTPEQVETIKKEIDELRKSIHAQSMTLNGNAETVFRAASSDPKKTLELYLRCRKKLDFEDQDREDREWREWEDKTKETHDFEPLIRGMQLQLRYLSLVTRAAQQESISSIFPDLISYMQMLGKLEEPPHPVLNQDISNTVFANVYGLDQALKRKANTWEMNPMKIEGIYDKTILPYLRKEKPENLKKAWEQRSQQETQMAVLFLRFDENTERMLKKAEDKSRATQVETKRMVQFIEAQARKSREFKKDRLPLLHWSSAKDQYNHVNKSQGSKDMLNVIKANLKHEQAEVWLGEFEKLVAPD